MREAIEEKVTEGDPMDMLSTTGYNRRPPHLVAEYKGFFAKEGLEVKYHETTFAPDHNRGMAEGRWDFSLSSADTMIARATTDGVDYMLFMQAEEGLTASLVGQPGVNSIEQLRGKLLAGDPGDSNLDLIRKKILRTHGMDDTEYDIEIIGSSPKRYEAFMERRGAPGRRGRLRAQLAVDLRLGAQEVAGGSPGTRRALYSRLGRRDGLAGPAQKQRG